MQKRRRRETETVSLSFLDVISCGFGALILLLVLTKVFEPVILERTIADISGYVAALQEERFEIRGQLRVLSREKVAAQDQKTEKLERLARLQQELTGLRARYDQLSDKSRVDNRIEGQLARARQSLTEEMKRLLTDYERKEDNPIGGVPVDSEYVIFIIDTSPSMFNNAWDLVLAKLEETLAVYPRLKGIQVMNDMGKFMFPQYANSWIPDTAARRNAIMERLRTWNVFSNSSPVEGITRAISTFYKPGLKISLYVFGDSYSGTSIQQVVDKVDGINKAFENGERLVRIHALGFPTVFSEPPAHQLYGVRYAILMRILCERNGGTFVGLDDYRKF
ncbi:MAG: VWA domain-containing protein [Gammaproteobacteria bacterium]|nr:VWA domain-containing protein [Gammaproteobacteria bacterium]